MNEFDHDYYILSEDDYVFVEHNFDTILVEEYEKSKAEYLVVWKELKDVVSPRVMKEYTSTIGILNREIAKELFSNYNDTVMTLDNAGQNMYKFMTTFNTIGTLEEERFHPYWTGSEIFVYGNGSMTLNQMDNPLIFENTMSSCYQFYIKNKEKFINEA